MLCPFSRSHPTGVRGLKSALRYAQDTDTRVAPHWGAWIEITTITNPTGTSQVAPHWGAWIEILCGERQRECSRVAPHWGAWIEISYISVICSTIGCRTPLGCVD